MGSSLQQAGDFCIWDFYDAFEIFWIPVAWRPLGPICHFFGAQAHLCYFYSSLGIYCGPAPRDHSPIIIKAAAMLLAKKIASLITVTVRSHGVSIVLPVTL